MDWTPYQDSRIPPNGVSSNTSSLLHLVLGTLLVILSLTACDNGSSAGSSENAPQIPSTTQLPEGTVDSEAGPTVTPEPSPTPPPPSPTPQLAAMVNGQPILLEDYEKELQRYEQAMAELGFNPGDDGQDYHLLVLDALIEKELIRQAAKVAGVSITPDQVESKVAELRQATSEPGSFESWLAANQWTEDEFKEALAVEMLVEAMIAEITADVPYTAEQVRASYIQLDDAAVAESLLSQIREGADFADLAARYSRDLVTGSAGGDLGFFARGSLLVPELEETAYQLNPEETSEVIAVTDPESGTATYYIIKVTERDPNRPLNTDLRYRLLQERFDSWLNEQRTNATILYLLVEE
jgi:peptidyl-prolyl cis-trans isomerase C